MFRNKPLNKHFKKAQQIVELALVLPFFIICFSFVFQLMVETYAKYKFSYIFTNSVARAVESQTVYTNMSDAQKEFNFANFVKNATIAASMNIPHQGIEINTLIFEPPADSEDDEFKGGVNNYIAGTFITDVERLFFKSTGIEYFYFIIPINRIYFEPLVLNITNKNLDDFFNDWYYEVFKDVYSSSPAAPSPSVGGSSSSGGSSDDSGSSGSSTAGSEGGGDDSSSSASSDDTPTSAWGDIETSSGSSSGSGKSDDDSGDITTSTTIDPAD